jgi:predicted transcriptional regulator
MNKSKKKVKFEKLNELKGEMKKAEITNEQMAKMLGRSTSGFIKILDGDVDISRSTMKKIVSIMNKLTEKNYTMQNLFS